MRRGDLAFSLLNVLLGFDIFFFMSNLVVARFVLRSRSVVTFFFVTFHRRGNVTVSLCMRTNILDEKFV